MATSTGEYFPQPSRPLNAYDTNIGSMTADNRFSDQYCSDRFNDANQENRTRTETEHDHDQILREIMDELDEMGHEMLKKLLAKVEKDHFREILHDFKGKHVSEILEKLHRKLNSGEVKGHGTSMERDLDIGDGSHKLERFKVKIVNVPGVGDVKEDDK